MIFDSKPVTRPKFSRGVALAVIVLPVAFLAACAQEPPPPPPTPVYVAPPPPPPPMRVPPARG